jgi:CheY-like chemotaxis protein
VLEAMLDGAMAGFDLARTLAREFPALPLIMLSRVDEVISDLELATQDRDDGWMPVQRFMEKPVSPEVLVYEVDHLLPVAHGR